MKRNRVRPAWTFVSAREGFEIHASRWDDLNREHGNHILLDSQFVGALVRHFATEDTLLAVSERPGARGLVLLEPTRRRFPTTFQPSQGPLGLILLESDDQAIPMSLDLLAHLPGFALCLSVLHQDPAFTRFGDAKGSGRLRRIEYIDTGEVGIEGPFEAYWQSRGSNLRHNLARQRRRLVDAGRRLDFQVIRDPVRASECIATYGSLEASGWKASTGTAVGSDNAQGAFYRDMLERLMATHEAYVLHLELDGKVIASDLCVEREGMVVILKTAYDSSVPGLSPGLLLHEEAFRYWFDSGSVRGVEFYGGVLDWHRKWTDSFRRMYHLDLYRGRWAAWSVDLARRAKHWRDRPQPEGTTAERVAPVAS